MALNLKKFFSDVGNKIKSVIPTIKEKSSAILQTVASISTGNVAGVVAGVGSILSPVTSSTSSAVAVTSVKNESTETWKEKYNKFTKGL